MKFDINNYKGKVVMHCKTEEEANNFLVYLDSIGKKWAGGQSYLGNNFWHIYTINTIYDFNTDSYCDISWAKRYHYKILEWSDFMNKEFTKADLRTGDVVMQRDGNVQIANCELGIFITPTWWNDMSRFNSDLTHPNGDKYDIVAVRRPKAKSDCNFKAFDYNYGTLVYERKEVEEMTLAEVCKLLGKEIKIVK